MKPLVHCVHVSALGVCLIHVAGCVYLQGCDMYTCSVHICLLGMCLLSAGWTQGCGTQQLCLSQAHRDHFSLTVSIEFVNTHVHAGYKDALKLIAVQGAASAQLDNVNLPAPGKIPGWVDIPDHPVSPKCTFY